MNKLSGIQNQFQNYLLQHDPAIEQHVLGTEKVSVETRLAIYENAYRARLVDALAETYPVLKQYLGDDAFEELAHDYLTTYPSSFRSIRWFGDQLASFTQTHATYHAHPYLAELIQFEWTMTMVFDAADAPLLQLDDIARIPPDAWENMCFTAHPSARCLSCKWNMIPIWQMLSEQKSPAEPVESEQPVSWVLWRNNYLNQFCSLSEEEAWAIDAMLQGASFGAICEGLCQWIDEENAAQQAASLLKGWITAGLVSSVTVIPTTTL